ncbi:MAG: tandem-95 repeat protein [Pirellulales bacterium]|nr:tandem-95 repeat protein [Pirellulales bacterium]
MLRFRNSLGAILLFAVFFGGNAALGSTPFTEKIDSTPDYCQTDMSYGGMPGGGGVYCGPMAASNAVMWLADNGFPKLAPLTPDRKEDQFHVADTLGSEAYMHTYTSGGTHPITWATELADYIEDRGYTITRFEFQGWRDMVPPYDTGIDNPNLDWMRAGIEAENTVVCWNVGWCDYEPSTDIYHYKGAHYVTMVGHGMAPWGPDPDYFVIHDPSPRTGMTLVNNYVLTTPITSGELRNSSGGLIRNTAGLYELSGWPINSVGDCAILNGAYVIELAPVVNVAPVAVNDQYTLDEDAAISRVATQGFLSNDTDANGDPYLPTLLSGPAHGTLTSDYQGGFTYTPHANYSGTDSFTYRINDTMADSNVATVTFNIASVNDLPVPVDDIFNVTEDTPYQVPAGQSVRFNDQDVETLPWNLDVVLETTVQHGQLDLPSTGLFTYTPDPNFYGADTFTYRLFDGEDYSETTGTVTINVAPVNDAPVPVDDYYEVGEGGVLTVTSANDVLLNDIDVDSSNSILKVVGDITAQHGQVVMWSSGRFTYTPGPGFFGIDTFTYFVDDTHDMSTTAGTVTINVLMPGDATGDGLVDQLDARRLAEHWLDSDGVDWFDGDFNRDGIVDDLDASILAAHWGQSVEGVSVPEPGSLALLLASLAATLGLIWQRGR